MPEIAEVELRRELRPLVGAQLSEITVEDGRLALEDPALVREQEVTDIVRRGKLLGLLFANDEVVACHLRMTGSLGWKRAPHTRAILTFVDGRQLFFADPRGFGTLEILRKEDFGSSIGPDLLDDPEKLKGLWEKASRSRRAIKAVLLDQHVIGGIGNYLADESLFRARINPQTPTSLLGDERWDELCVAAHEIAGEALEHGGVSIRDYKHVDGSSGEMQNQLLCYGRAGHGCVRCGTTLVASKVGGRGTTHCPNCQKLQLSGAVAPA